MTDHYGGNPPSPEPAVDAGRFASQRSPGESSEATTDGTAPVSIETSAPALDVVLTACMPAGSEVNYWTRRSPLRVAGYDRNKRDRERGRRVQVVLGEGLALSTCDVHQIAPAAGVTIGSSAAATVHEVSGATRPYVLTVQLPDVCRGGSETVLNGERRTFHPGVRLTLPGFASEEEALEAAPVVTAVVGWQIEARARLASWGPDVLVVAADLVRCGVTVSEDDLHHAAVALVGGSTQQRRRSSWTEIAQVASDQGRQVLTGRTLDAMRLERPEAEIGPR